MHTQALSHPPAPTAPHPWLVAMLGAWRERLRRWCERQRRLRAYRRDLVVLAAMGERDLADIGAPCWLRADVARVRAMPTAWW